MPHHWIMEHGLMNEDETAFNWRGLDLRVEKETKPHTYTDREYEGGGWYSKGERVTEMRTTMYAYDGEFLVGIIQRAATFKDPKRMHIIISRTK